MRILTIVAGSLLLLLGLISLVTPIVGGTLAIAAGAGMIICASETATNAIRAWRIKYARFNRIVNWFENKMGESLSKPLRLTRPDEQSVPTKTGISE